MLSGKRLRFCEIYLETMNAADSAVKAGYSPRSANVTASRLLKNDMVKQYLEHALKERAERTGVSTDYVVKNLVEIVERCLHEKDPNGRNKFDAQAANRALELLGKHLGMFSEKSIVQDQKDIHYKISWENGN